MDPFALLFLLLLLFRSVGGGFVPWEQGKKKDLQGGKRRLLPVREAAAFGIKAGTTDTLVRSSSSSTDVCVYTVFRQEREEGIVYGKSGDRLLFRFPPG